jgi:hypothetical protein
MYTTSGDCRRGGGLVVLCINIHTIYRKNGIKMSGSGMVRLMEQAPFSGNVPDVTLSMVSIVTGDTGQCTDMCKKLSSGTWF